MNDRDVEALLRTALADRAHTLVPEGDAARPAPPGATLATPTAAGPSRRNRIWWASGLVAAAAAVVVGAVVVTSSEVDASRPAPAATVVTAPTATPTTSAAPTPTVSAVTRPDEPTTSGGEVGAGEVTPGATASSSAPADAEIYVRADCNEPANDPPVIRPTGLQWFCADDGESLADIRWSTWSEAGATGIATVSWKTCQPDCASGPVDHRSGVAVGLSDPVDDGGTRFWTHLHVAFDPFPNAPTTTSQEDFTLGTTP